MAAIEVITGELTTLGADAYAGRVVRCMFDERAARGMREALA